MKTTATTDVSNISKTNIFLFDSFLFLCYYHRNVRTNKRIVILSPLAQDGTFSNNNKTNRFDSGWWCGWYRRRQTQIQRLRPHPGHRPWQSLAIFFKYVYLYCSLSSFFLLLFDTKIRFDRYNDTIRSIRIYDTYYDDHNTTTTIQRPRYNGNITS